MSDPKALGQKIERLLADPDHHGHPLHQAVAELYANWQHQCERIDRLARISDSYQALARDEHASLSQRYRHEIKRLGKIARISDRYQSLMREANVALEEASTHDALTRLGNRRLLLQQLRYETERADRHEHPLQLAVLDIDRFKEVNDSNGHVAGDRVLVAVADAIAASIREYDHCGRWGGEEFLLLLPHTPDAEVLGVVERVRRAASAVFVPLDDGSRIRVTLSAGVAQARRGEPIEQLIARADGALYAAKNAGRDRSVVAEQTSAADR